MGATWAETATTITAGGTRQALAAANANRKGFVFMNNSTAALYVRVGGQASASAGIGVDAGASISFTGQDTPVQALDVFGATTGQAFTFYEW